MARRAELPFDPKAFLTKANGGRSLSRFRKDEIIFSQDDPADAIFYVIEGNVKITVLNEQGKEAVVAILGSDEFFGEGCLTGQPLRITTAHALTESTVMRLEKQAMIRALHHEPELDILFIGHLLKRRGRIEADLVDQLFNPVEKRLARALLLLANFGEESETERVVPKVSQETLAEMIGTTRSRVSHFMNKFRKLGFINYNGKMAVRSSLLNVILHDDPQSFSTPPSVQNPERHK